MTSINIKGMTCGHCVIAATKAISALDGVKDVKVDLKTGVATYCETKVVDPMAVALAIQKAGFEVVK